MKTLVFASVVLSCALVSWGETFQMDRKGETTVEVKKSADEYKVTCRFKPQTKFDKAVNAKFNDAKGDSLCKKGLARYLNVATNETLIVSGQYSVAPVKTEREMLCYSFGVPVSGCEVAKVAVRPKPQVVTEKPTVDISAVAPVMTNAAPGHKEQGVSSAEPSQMKAARAVRSSSYVCVARYREVNGKREVISQKEYKECNFKSRKEFDQFCQQEFARVRAVGEANLRAVRNSGR